MTDSDEHYDQLKASMPDVPDFVIKNRIIENGRWVIGSRDPFLEQVKQNGVYELDIVTPKAFDDDDTTRLLIEEFPSIPKEFIEQRRMDDGYWIIDDQCPYATEIRENKIGIPVKVVYGNGTGSVDNPSTMALWSGSADMMIFKNNAKARYDAVPPTIFLISTDKNVKRQTKIKRIAEWIGENEDELVAHWVLNTPPRDRLALYRFHAEAFATHFTAKAIGLESKYKECRQAIREYVEKSGGYYDEYLERWYTSGRVEHPRTFYFIPEGIPPMPSISDDE